MKHNLLTKTLLHSGGVFVLISLLASRCESELPDPCYGLKVAGNANLVVYFKAAPDRYVASQKDDCNAIPETKSNPSSNDGAGYFDLSGTASKKYFFKIVVHNTSSGCFEGTEYIFDKPNASRIYTVRAPNNETTTASLYFYEGCNSCAKTASTVRILWSTNVLIKANSNFQAALNPTSYINNEFYTCQ